MRAKGTAPLLPMKGRGKGVRVPFLCCLLVKIDSTFLLAFDPLYGSISLDPQKFITCTKCNDCWRHMFTSSSPKVKVLMSSSRHNQCKCPSSHFSSHLLLSCFTISSHSKIYTHLHVPFFKLQLPPASLLCFTIM